MKIILRKIVSENRTTNSIVTAIRLENNINLIITQDSVYDLTVEGGENLLPYIKTDVTDDGTLNIKNKNKCNFLRSYKKDINVYLKIPDLKYIYFAGKGDITSTNTLQFKDLTLETNNLTILQHTGPSDFTISGSSKNTYFYSGGNGWFFCNNLISDDAHVNSNGSGDIALNVKNNLLVELTHIGNVIYSGNPSVSVSVHTGSGKIIKK